MTAEQNIDYATLAGALLAGIGGVGGQIANHSRFQAAYKAIGSTPTGTYGHGPGGLFSSPALDRKVFSALMLPHQGLLSRLPTHPSNFAQPLYGIMTGVTATTGSEPSGVCDDFPVAGLMKLCAQTAYFGRQGRQTRIFELDRMGLLNSRGEHVDLQLYGNAGGGSVDPLGPTIPASAGNPLNQEVAKAMFELGVAWSRDFAYEVYTGNPTNNTAGGGRKYYRGLDLLINTGYRDAETGTVCPAADSTVVSFGSLNLATNGAAIVRRITSMYRNLNFIANMTGLNPVKWVLAMPWAMFYELSEVWPCAYMTYRCQNTFTTSQTQVTDSQRLIDMRDEMRGDIYNRTGQYLLIDGDRVEVVLDDSVTETVGAGATFAGSIYFVPMTVLGGVEVTYLEYLNYDMPGGAMDAAAAIAPNGMFFTSDGGRFLWHREPPTNYCVRLKAKTETRIIMRTPHLAARLTNVLYVPLAHERGWDPTAGNANNSFYTNGGSTDRININTVQSFYTPT